MMRALFSGVTGLRTHQTRMDVIGNNISNVNTLGFKKSAANFADLYSETVSPASAPTANQGGINARQIGLGVTCNSIVIKHTPGAAQYTGNTLDLAITGDGFFTLRTPDGERYTRAGNLSVSSNGSLVNPSGYFVQCFNSVYQQGNAGEATSVGINGKETKTYFDTFSWEEGGANIKVAPSGSYTFELNENNKVNVYKNGILVQEDLDIVDDGGTPVTDASQFAAGTEYHIDTEVGTIKFTSKVATDPDNTFASQLVELAGVLENASIEVTNNDTFVAGNTIGDMIIDQDAYENISINEEGAVIAQLKSEGVPPGIDGAQTMAKGEKVVLGYLAISNFTNTEGLEKISGNLYAATTNSGRVTHNLAGDGGTGTITPSSLEMSNVDLSEEMVNMITTQRGFQANSRIITTTDSMLEELINLKR